MKLSMIKKGMLGIVLLGLALFPFVTTNDYYIHMGQMIGITVIVTQGLNLLSGYAGQISLGHAGFYAVGAYAAAIVTTNFEMPFFIGVLASIICSGVVGLLLGLPALRVKGHYLAMVTIGAGIIIEKLLHEGGEFTGGFAGISGVPGVELFGHALSAMEMYYLVTFIAGLVTVFLWNLTRTRPGRAFLALRDSETAAEAMGVSRFRYKLIAFVISAMITGIGGNLYAHSNNYVSPDSFTPHLSVFLLVMIILGGMGTVIGPIIGTILLYILPEVLKEFDEYRLIIYGLILLGFIIGLPGGIASLLPKALKPKENLLNEENLVNQPIGNYEPSQQLKMKSNQKDILQVVELTKRFSGVVANNRVNMSVKAGTIHALIGPNGSGKTTCLHSISGLYQIDEGDVLFEGKSIKNLKMHEKIGVGIARTFQHAQTFKELTVIENVMVGEHRLRKTGFISGSLLLPQAVEEERESQREALKLLEWFGMKDLAFAKAGDLPYGYQKILEIVRAMAAQPKLLILDEPAAGLTNTEIEQLENILLKLCQAGLTILLVEHDMRLIMKVSDSITVLENGNVIAEGTPKDIQNNLHVIKAYLGEQKVG
ncbi:ATP-binding cassette domain-containing protein [Ammoniphilus sp. 3BR4]|uniref:branched-chain amino acid ABC transporter ATP-binding protein/permease n=1 Tax=Ammoniphilus sp. 3BR4 TaxID=3158265 RepID=UPI0034664289